MPANEPEPDVIGETTSNESLPLSILERTLVKDSPPGPRTRGVNPQRNRADPYESAYWRALLLVLLLVPFLPVLLFGLHRQASKDPADHATGRGIVRGAFHGLGLGLLLAFIAGLTFSAWNRPAQQRQADSEYTAEQQRDALRYGDPETPNTLVEENEQAQMDAYRAERQAQAALSEKKRALNKKGIGPDPRPYPTYAPAEQPLPELAPEAPPPAAPEKARSPSRRDPATVGIAEPAPGPDGDKRLVEALARPAPAQSAKPAYAITLKDGGTIDAVQLVDGGDVYSVKTAAGKFITLKKADVADVPAELLPKR